jgi:hypothetical protein
LDYYAFAVNVTWRKPNFLLRKPEYRGFARIGCNGCRYQAIPVYSCKCRLFCPSFQQKRVLPFAEWLDTHILD